MSSLEVVVPVRWSGLPFADGSTPLAWLGADGFELAGAGGEPPVGALRLRFRAGMTMGDRVQLERALDEINGGPENTNDLEVAHAALQFALQSRYEALVWPEGRPEATTQDEVREQMRAINDRLFDDLHVVSTDTADDGEQKARGIAATFDRVAQQRQLARDLAEMRVLLIGPREWRDLVAREWEDPDHIDAVVAAYRHARAERREQRGNSKRSAA